RGGSCRGSWVRVETSVLLLVSEGDEEPTVQRAYQPTRRLSRRRPQSQMSPSGARRRVAPTPTGVPMRRPRPPRPLAMTARADQYGLGSFSSNSPPSYGLAVFVGWELGSSAGSVGRGGGAGA